MTSICISTCICICIYICICICICMCLWQGILIQLSIEPWPAFALICVWRTHHLQLLRNGWEVTPQSSCMHRPRYGSNTIWKTFQICLFGSILSSQGPHSVGLQVANVCRQIIFLIDLICTHLIATTGGIWTAGDSEKRLRVALWLQLHNERCSF